MAELTMRVSERSQKVAMASPAVALMLIEFQQERDLTSSEMLHIVATWQVETLKYMIRAERADG